MILTQPTAISLDAKVHAVIEPFRRQFAGKTASLIREAMLD